MLENFKKMPYNQSKIELFNYYSIFLKEHSAVFSVQLNKKEVHVFA